MVEMIRASRDKAGAESGEASRGQRGKSPPGPHGEIGFRLRALFAEAEREPLPERLIDLLEQLDRVEEAAKPDGKSREPS